MMPSLAGKDNTQPQPQAQPLPYAALAAYAEAMELFSFAATAMERVIALFHQIVVEQPDEAARELLLRDFSKAGERLVEILRLTSEDLERAKQEAAKLSEDTYRAQQGVRPLLEPSSASRFAN